MATLRIVCAVRHPGPPCADTEVEVHNATSMAYAAYHVAAAMGLDDKAPGWRLLNADAEPPGLVQETM